MTVLVAHTYLALDRPAYSCLSPPSIIAVHPQRIAVYHRCHSLLPRYRVPPDPQSQHIYILVSK